MGVPRRAQLSAGTPVSIVLKQDQRTGKQVQGVVSDILTRGDHHRGVKVRLRDGRVGRVQALLGASSSGTTPDYRVGSSGAATDYRVSSSSGGSTMNNNPIYTPPHTSPIRDARYDDEYRYDSSQAASRPTIGDFLSFPDEQAPPRPRHPPARPAHPPSRPTRPEYRTEQSPPYHLHMFDRPALAAEVESHGRQASIDSAVLDGSTADRDQELLREEFPKIDGALIAAVYHDLQDLASCREVLEQLST